ncbi:MAG: inositol monophosphatase family protein, partial [Alphaproteobacteria bacterium]|nr:inositol monophosphatase family protein [Alphaproteobacteria bacterium]
IEELSHARPKYGFLVEERGEIKGENESDRFIIDPLDGTTNFLHGIPHFAISIAHERNRELEAGVIFDPIKDEMYWAVKGGGAWMNDRRLRVSSRNKLDQAVLGTGVPHLGRGDHGEFLAIVEQMMSRVSGIRRFGAAALDLAYVASGRFDGFWELDLHPWDIAAGQLLVREAGGYCTDYAGRDKAMQSGEVLAANDNLHPMLSRLIRELRRERASA